MGYLDIALKVIEGNPKEKKNQTKEFFQGLFVKTNYEINELNEKSSSPEEAIPIQAEAFLSAPKPYLDAEGDLVIPFNCDSKYHWWAGGQTISDTLKELTREELNSTKGEGNWQSK